MSDTYNLEYFHFWWHIQLEEQRKSFTFKISKESNFSQPFKLGWSSIWAPDNFQMKPTIQIWLMKSMRKKNYTVEPRKNIFTASFVFCWSSDMLQWHAGNVACKILMMVRTFHKKMIFVLSAQCAGPLWGLHPLITDACSPDCWQVHWCGVL